MKLNLGCGKDIKEGWLNVDKLLLAEGAVVADLAEPWPWDDGSVDEVFCSHMVEHLTWPERIHFFNELFRVLKVGAKAQIIVPHWASARWYGDPTHKEPMSEWAFLYLLKEWRALNAPHVNYDCDFDYVIGYSLNPALMARNQEYQQYAIANYKEAASDMFATLTKRGTP